MTHPVKPRTTAANYLTSQPLIGESQAIQAIKTYIAKVALTDSNVLVTGETGTGKELVAEQIHRHSRRSRQPFICINCAALADSLLESELFGYERGAFTGATALTRGKFELANGGTLFLDEIGDINPYAQAKLLRAVESQAVLRLGGQRSIPLNTRIVAATNQDLDRIVAAGRCAARRRDRAGDTGHRTGGFCPVLPIDSVSFACHRPPQRCLRVHIRLYRAETPTGCGPSPCGGLSPPPSPMATLTPLPGIGGFVACCHASTSALLGIPRAVSHVH
jgi:hypothetical protein